MLKKNCKYFNTLSTDQKAQLASLSDKACKDKKMATSQIIDLETVAVLGEVKATTSMKMLVRREKIPP